MRQLICLLFIICISLSKEAPTTFEKITITFEHKFAADNSLLFGVFAPEGGAADSFIEEVQKNKDAYKRVSSFLGQATFHIK